jgi:hypothetical protein
MKNLVIYGRLIEQEDSAQNLGMPGAQAVISALLETGTDARYVAGYTNQVNLNVLGSV